MGWHLDSESRVCSGEQGAETSQMPDLGLPAVTRWGDRVQVTSQVYLV